MCLALAALLARTRGRSARLLSGRRDGVRDRGAGPLRFAFVYAAGARSVAAEAKAFAMDLRRAGVLIELAPTEAGALLPRLESGAFDLAPLVWEGLPDEDPRVLVVVRGALGLTVGAVVAPGLNALVPLEAHPAEIVQDRLLGRLNRALAIRVFDPQNEGAVLSARQQPIEEGRARVADVQLAGGGWSETDPH